jgi:hypothetical protein
LSRRDAAWIGSVYSALGLSVGTIVHEKAYVYDEKFNNQEFDDERMKKLRDRNKEMFGMTGTNDIQRQDTFKNRVEIR